MASETPDQRSKGVKMAELEAETPLKHKGGEGPSKGGEDDDESELEVFSDVMAAVKLEQLPAYASQIRQSIHPDQKGVLPELGSPMFGSYHILYPVTFSDGVCWLFKIPANGTHDDFSDADAEGLKSEALTMRLLHKETTIPVPEVLAFNNSCDNECGCPFILLSYIEGKSLADVWHDKTSPKELVQTRRTRALHDIAAAMVQLEKYSFDKGGTPVFDDKDQLSDIGSMQLANPIALVEYITGEERSDAPQYDEAGPFLDPKAYHTAPLEHRGEQESTFGTGVLLILRLFLDLIQEPCDGRKPFVLTHPDFDIQNFLVSEEGELRGIIDWDGVYSAPRSIGNEQLPGWLTRDWDSIHYAWNEEMEKGTKPDDIVWEDSPETLRFYRSVYASAMRSCLNSEPLASSTAATITTTSLIYQNLNGAASSPLFTTAITVRVLEEIVSRVQDLQKDHKGGSDDDEDELSVYDVIDAIAEDRLSQHHRSLLMRGFQWLVDHSAEL